MHSDIQETVAPPPMMAGLVCMLGLGLLAFALLVATGTGVGRAYLMASLLGCAGLFLPAAMLCLARLGRGLSRA